MVFWGYLLCLVAGYTTCRLREKYPKIKQIYDIIHEHTPSRIRSIQKTISTVVSIQYNDLYNKYVQKVKQPIYITHEIFDVEYYHKGKKYNIRISDKTKKHISINAYDSTGTDISSVLLSYLGPNYDFHGKTYTPRLLGYESLTIIDESLNQIIFQADDPINLS